MATARRFNGRNEGPVTTPIGREEPSPCPSGIFTSGKQKSFQTKENLPILWQDIPAIYHNHPLMPVVLKIDPQRRIVYSAFYGSITDAEVAGHRSAIASDPDFNPAFNEVVDFSAVTEVNLSESTLSVMAQTPSLFIESVLHIVVAPADILFQIASRYGSFARLSRPNVFVVRTRDEAYQLLSAGQEPPRKGPRISRLSEP